MGKKKIAFQLTVDIPEATVKNLVAEAVEFMSDNHDVIIKAGDLQDSEEFMKAVKKALNNHIVYSLDDIYAYDMLDELPLEKMFKAQIKVAEAKYKAELKAEEAKREADRIATAGVIRMNPKDLKDAIELLKEAGITVTT
jgi:hypothetical protein